MSIFNLQLTQSLYFQLLTLSREKRGTLVTLQTNNGGSEEQNQILILSGDNLDQAIQVS